MEELLLAKTSSGKASYVFDAISSDGTLETTLRFLNPNGGIVSTVLPPILFVQHPKTFKYPPGVTTYNSASVWVHSTERDFGYVWSRYMGRLLQEGRLEAHPYEFNAGGLDGVLTGLEYLRDGKAKTLKYVYRIDETKTRGHDIQNTTSIRTQPAPSSHLFRNFLFPASDE